MHRLFLVLLATISIACPEKAVCAGNVGSDPQPIAVGPDDWPWWRGPSRNGVADSRQKPPLQWSEEENVVWKNSIPGRGHGSPTVVGNDVYLATADDEREIQSVLCYDRQSGDRTWKTDVHAGGFAKKINENASHASSTVACDGERIYINFLNGGAVYTTALSRNGEQLWQKKITDYAVHQGYGSSPALYESLVIVSADNKGGGAIAALDRSTGEIVWRVGRPKRPNYASPIILHVAGRDQLLFSGCDLISGFDPLSGQKLWEAAGATTECVTSIVTDGQRVFTSGGYPKNHMSAVQADGSGKTDWENNVRVYVPSLLVREGYLYNVADAGIAMCWKCDTGEQVWKGRLEGTFSASPVMVGEQIFATSESGKTFIFKASPDEFEVVSENELGDDVIATPAICGSRIYMRVAKWNNGGRQEMIYCLGRDS